MDTSPFVYIVSQYDYTFKWSFYRIMSKNILCKINDHTAEKGHKALRPLAGIVTFEGETDLNDAEAKQNCADGFDGAEHKVAQIVDGRQRIVRKNRQRHNKKQRQPPSLPSDKCA